MSQESLDLHALCRVWYHSREEDTPGQTVYRPAGYAFPPSRGRPGVEFRADGSYKRIGIGPTDTSAVSEGSWRVDDEQTGRLRVESGVTSLVLTIAALAPDRLVLHKGSPRAAQVP